MSEKLENFIARMIVVSGHSNVEAPLGVGWSPNKDQRPWDHDSIEVFRKQPAEPNFGFGSVDSDRLFQWSPDKYNRFCLEVWGNNGQLFYERSAKDISRFLSLYLGYKVELHLAKECCNAMSGHKIWHFQYALTEERRTA